MTPKSAKLRQNSLLRQSSVKFGSNFTRASNHFTQTLFARSYVFASLPLKVYRCQHWYKKPYILQKTFKPNYKVFFWMTNIIVLILCGDHYHHHHIKTKSHYYAPFRLQIIDISCTLRSWLHSCLGQLYIEM